MPHRSRLFHVVFYVSSPCSVEPSSKNGFGGLFLLTHFVRFVPGVECVNMPKGKRCSVRFLHASWSMLNKCAWHILLSAHPPGSA